MTSELFITILLSGIFTALLFIAKSVQSDLAETNQLLKQIRNNTTDKTIPVKPVNVSANYETTKWAYCPICRRSVHSNEKYCDRCGTKLDWGDTE